jgi:rhomboid protease GluP
MATEPSGIGEALSGENENWAPGADVSAARRPWATYLAIAINVVVYVVMVTMFGTLTFSALEAFEAGASFGPAISGGEVWRVFTANWIHVSPPHILSNMVVLLVWGTAVEQRIGSTRFAVFYLASGLGGSIASVLINPDIVSAGASGAISGVAGMLLMLWFRGDRTISVSNLATNLVINAMLPVVVGGIDWVAHVGGFVTGAALQFLFRVRNGE